MYAHAYISGAVHVCTKGEQQTYNLQMSVPDCCIKRSFAVLRTRNQAKDMQPSFILSSMLTINRALDKSCKAQERGTSTLYSVLQGRNKSKSHGEIRILNELEIVY